MQLFNCDSLTVVGGRLTSWAGTVYSIDTVDKVEGTGSLVMTPATVGWENRLSIEWFGAYVKNLSTELGLVFPLKVDDASKDVLVSVAAPDYNNRLDFTLKPPSSGVWNKIQIPFANMTVYGTPNLATVTRIGMWYVVQEQNLSFKLDDLGTYTPAPPPPVSTQGTLRVETTPTAGEVFINSQPWGPAPIEVVINIPPGQPSTDLAIEFGPMQGYITPDSVLATVYTDQITTVPGLYKYILHVLNISSNLLGVSFSIVKGESVMSYVTPWSGSLEEGTYQVVMPASIQVGTKTYNFSSWEDASTNPVRDIPLTADKTVTATFTEAPTPPLEEGILTIDTEPVKGEVYVNGSSWGTAPQSRTLTGASYNISFGEYTGYTKPSPRSADVVANMETTVTETYTALPPSPGVISVDTEPVKGEVFVDGVSEGSAPVIVQKNPGDHVVSFGSVQGYVTPTSVTVSVISGQTTQVLRTYAAVPPAVAVLEIHTYDKGAEVNATGRIVETGQTFTTPANIEVQPGTYTVELTYQGVSKTQQATASGGQSTPVNVDVTPPTLPRFNKMILIPIGAVVVGIAGLGLLGRGKKSSRKK